MTGHFLGEYQLLFTPLSSHYRACYLRHSRLEQLSPLSPSPLYLQTSYKSLPEIWGKLQEAANYNIHRACTNPRAYPCCTLGQSEVFKTGCENRFPCFWGLYSVDTKMFHHATYQEYISSWCILCPVAPEHFVLQNHIHYGALPPRLACPKLFDNAGTKYIVRSLLR